MSFTNRDRPQNQHPDQLIKSRKDAAQQNYEAVHVTVQAMRRRGTPPEAITIQTVAKESHVSIATIYRRDDLFALIRRANPRLQRRQAESVYREEIGRLKEEVTKAQEQAFQHKQEAGVVKLADRQFLQENIKLKKQVLALTREVNHLKAQLAACTCGAKDHGRPHLHQEE